MVPSSTKNLALKSRILWGQVINQDQTVIKDKLLYKIETLIGLKKKKLRQVHGCYKAAMLFFCTISSTSCRLTILSRNVLVLGRNSQTIAT